MPDFLTQSLSQGAPINPLEVLIRLVAALALGTAVAWIYRHTRKATDAAGSFPTTLVLLAILIAMVTQVIGDNIARAFSLVGALSIVRFRTVVRDTEDTAYVIFAVAVGMAVGANDFWVAILGLLVIGLTAFLHRARPRPLPDSPLAIELNLRLGIGQDVNRLLGGLLDSHLLERELVCIETAQKGVALDISYHAQLRGNTSAESLVRELNRAEGVQNVQLRRRGCERD